VQHALALGQRYRAEVIVMSVRADVAPSVWDARHVGPPARSDGDAAQQLFAVAHAAAGVAPAEAIVVNGSVVPEILRAAEAQAVDLLVVGMHGPPSGFRHLFLSPLTERIVDKAGSPVLAVARRPPEDVTSAQVMFRTIVCGVDRSTSSRRALTYAIELSHLADAWASRTGLGRFKFYRVSITISPWLRERGWSTLRGFAASARQPSQLGLPSEARGKRQRRLADRRDSNPRPPAWQRKS
jgi:nucleotide-binding universal stress UspA family protein